MEVEMAGMAQRAAEGKVKREVIHLFTLALSSALRLGSDTLFLLLLPNLTLCMALPTLLNIPERS